jgi:hypothetical protein
MPERYVRMPTVAAAVIFLAVAVLPRRRPMPAAAEV